MNKFAEIMTLETTYLFQLQQPDGSWGWYSQAEYRTEEGCREDAASVYGNAGIPFRIVKIVRSIIED